MYKEYFDCIMGMFTIGIMHMQSSPDITPPWFGGYESLWKEIPYVTALKLNVTLDMSPQIAMNKQWHYIGVWF